MQAAPFLMEEAVFRNPYVGETNASLPRAADAALAAVAAEDFDAVKIR